MMRVMTTCILELHQETFQLSVVEEGGRAGAFVARRALAATAGTHDGDFDTSAEALGRLARLAREWCPSALRLLVPSPRFLSLPGARALIDRAAEKEALLVWAPETSERALLAATARSASVSSREPAAAIDIDDEWLGVGLAGTGGPASAAIDLGSAVLEWAIEREGVPLEPGDSVVVESLLRLRAGPGLRGLRERGPRQLLLSFQEARAIRAAAIAWGYLEVDEESLPRPAYRALAHEILAAGESAIRLLGAEAALARRTPLAALMSDAVAGLLGVVEVSLVRSFLPEGIALRMRGSGPRRVGGSRRLQRAPHDLRANRQPFGGAAPVR